MTTPVKTWEQRQKEEGCATVDAQLEEITELRALCQAQAARIESLEQCFESINRSICDAQMILGASS